MPLHIIIDGYNVIRQSKKLSILDIQDIQEGREGLLELLIEYRKKKGHRITIVYDGTNAVLQDSRRHSIAGVKILFSRLGETADSVIKRIVAQERHGALVVTSDRDIIDHATTMGSATIGSNAFEKKIFQALYGFDDDDLEDPIGKVWRPTTRKKGPSRRLPKKKRRHGRKVNKL